MRSVHSHDVPARRQFLKLSARLAALGLTRLGVQPARRFLVRDVQGQGRVSDYKALVCVYMFGGNDALKEEAGWLADACRKSRPRPGEPAVRMPGDSANAMRRKQISEGVVLHPSIIPELKKLAEKWQIAVPRPLN